jgi:hypothetical protein
VLDEEEGAHGVLCTALSHRTAPASLVQACRSTVREPRLDGADNPTPRKKGVRPRSCGSGQVGLLGEREAARLGRAAGETGARQRARDVAAGAIGGRGQLRALRRAVAGDLVGAEDLFRVLAGQQRLELLALDRLALEQQLGDLRERLAVLGQDVLGLLVGALDDPADLVVDLARDLVGVVRLGGELTAQERRGRGRTRAGRASRSCRSA